MTAWYSFAAAHGQLAGSFGSRQRTTKTERCTDDIEIRQDYRRRHVDSMYAAKGACAELKDEWNCFRLSLAEAAKETRGVRTPAVMQVKAAPWTSDVKMAVKCYRRAKWEMIAALGAFSANEFHCRSRRVAYAPADTFVRREVRSQRRRLANRKELTLNGHYSTNIQDFCRTIRRMQSSGRAVNKLGSSIKDEHGRTLSNKKEISRRWRDHFVSLLNPLSANALDTGGDATNGGADESFDADCGLDCRARRFHDCCGLGR